MKYAILLALALVSIAPSVALAGPQGQGRFGGQAVQQQIKQRMPSIRRCYESELRRDPTLAGKVTVSLTVGRNGAVTETKTTGNTTGNAPLAACINRTIARLHFASGSKQGDMTFSYPFVFQPQR